MKRKGYKKIILATLISVLLIGSAGAVYATQPYVSEKLILSEETVDAISNAMSRDGKTMAWNYDFTGPSGAFPSSSQSNATIHSGKNWSIKIKVKTLIFGNLGRSEIWAFSNDGKVAAGFSSFKKEGGAYIHATIWSERNWENKTDLGTLRNDNAGNSIVFSLSADGKIAAGTSESATPFQRATIWSGNNWATKTDLGTLRNDNSGGSSVSSLSSDGKIAAGNSESDLKEDVTSNFYQRPVIWAGDNWATKIDVGTLRKDNLGKAQINALSNDGKIAAGTSEIDTVTKEVYQQATIWSGENWATKTRLGSLRSDNLGNSQVIALSADGKIAAGYSETDSKTIHAIIWSGENWETKTDLGTFKSDNAGSSGIEALSADGTIAVGFSSTDAKGRRAVLWKIIYPAASSESGSNAPNSAHIHLPMQPTQ
ncbi:hypothetical protein LZ757_07030 [Xylella fastidiosa subsp. morus]|uniref:hypothetical protein n=1 Tax=Xylella fastidiosa TaxID=2371 RepID=UPI0003ED1842|nr:hypothetical protein [Xylella fastidiosa]AIC12349.1 autotransporter [Xylella fastidiosa MUL0034]EWG14213.1 hypothetical protein P910_002418 [Xylella fastidiosa Mul-MD]UIN27643.1 hypothetical protein IUD23_10170 [Xylella fastidiosa subsp. morus]UIT35830.1 hypothetical protein LZ757_07030 [Xylella fastidiosa subsp. morus]UIT38122.1 hypothetical protein LZ755_07045 [Xylella fastidiosa subsp. morus]